MGKRIYIEELGLSIRTSNMLKRSGYDTLADLKKASKIDLMNIKMFGERSLEEVIDVLARYGAKLAIKQNQKPSPTLKPGLFKRIILQGRAKLVDDILHLGNPDLAIEYAENIDAVLEHSKLTATERKILDLRYGLTSGKEKTIEEVWELTQLSYKALSFRDYIFSIVAKLRTPVNTLVLKGAKTFEELEIERFEQRKADQARYKSKVNELIYIEDLKIPEDMYKALKRKGIEYIDDLLALSEEELAFPKTSYFAKQKNMDLLLKILEGRGLALKPNNKTV